MTTSRHDLAHGRQGGRIVDFDRVELDQAPKCEVCGGAVITPNRTVHQACEIPDSPPALF